MDHLGRVLLAATAANAQGRRSGSSCASFGGVQFQRALWRCAAGPGGPAPAYGPRGYGQAYGAGPSEYGAPLLPPTEVYAVLRENGFPTRGAATAGVFYSISAIDRRGDDGRLVIDARDRRIVRFVPADRFSGYGGYGDGYYGAGRRPSCGPLEPMTVLRGRASTARRARRARCPRRSRAACRSRSPRRRLLR